MSAVNSVVIILLLDEHVSYMSEEDDVNDMYLGRAARMFARVTDKPCINLDAKTGALHICRRIHDLRVNEGTIEGLCDWIAPFDDRPEELTDGLVIGSDLLDVGDQWWLDIYFDWFLVFDPQLVKQSLEGDHSWTGPFLASVVRNRTIPRPPPDSRIYG